jgi:8-oxo-dGTP pyrophosphatase MutT (NUDIX family)
VTQITFSEIQARLAAREPRRIEDPEAWNAAVAIILGAAPASPDILLIKRAEKQGDPWSGQMALPGGRMDPTDGGLLDTVMREVLEETGIDLGTATVLGELDDFHPRNPILPRVIVRPFVFGLSARPEVVPNHEVALHMWASVDALLASSGQAEIEIRGSRLTRDAYLLGSPDAPHVVWGMTHRILTPFLRLITS